MNRRLLGIFILALFVMLLWVVSVRQSLLFLLGIGMGSVLAGARFGFTTGWRRLIEERDGSGVMAQLVLLFLAALISIPLLAVYPGELVAALRSPRHSF